MGRFHRDAPGIFYTPLNGGHWVVTRSAVAVEMLRKPALFSSDPKHNEANRRWPRTAPNQYDPPEHTNFRLILNPWFSPGIVARRTEEIRALRSEEHTSELQSLMRISYAVFCLKKKNTTARHHH